MNKVRHVLCVVAVGLLMSLAAPRAVAADDLKGALSDKKLTLTHVKTADKNLEKDDLSQVEEFAQSDLGQIVPCTLTLNADGTCQITYASSIKNGVIVEADINETGKWSIDGANIKIIEDTNDDNKVDEAKDAKVLLTGAAITDGTLTCALSLQGSFTGGVEKLGYSVVAKE